MKIRKLRTFPWLSLTLVLLSYGLWGWYISAYSLIWLIVGWFVAVLIAIMAIWTSRSVGELMRLGPRSVLTMLFLSLILTTAIAASSLFSVIAVLTLTHILARFELRLRGVRQMRILGTLILLSSIGLGLGWCVGRLLIPSYPFWIS